MRSTYTGKYDEDALTGRTKDADKSAKQSGEAFHACMLTGVQSRNVPIHYGVSARELILDDSGAIVGVLAERGSQRVSYRARRAVIIACGGFEYNVRMRKAFLDGPGIEGWAFYADAQRRVLDWDDRPIPRLYAVGEICSVFQFVYQGGGNLAEGIAFGRIAGRNAAAERPVTSALRNPVHPS